MLDTQLAVIDYFEALIGGSDNLDFAFEYGEPGYELDSTAKTPLIVFGSWWCRCDKFGVDGSGYNKLHAYSDHYPKTFQALEDQGVELEWYDEWITDHENGKAYRCQPDSYSWMPSYILTDDCEMLTPDDDIEAWIEWALNNQSRAILSVAYNGNDIEAAGFTKYVRDGYYGEYQSGWHQGMDDTPEAVDKDIRAEFGDDVDVVFGYEGNSQFYSTFCAYYRLPESENDQSEALENLLDLEDRYNIK